MNKRVGRGGGFALSVELLLFSTPFKEFKHQFRQRLVVLSKGDKAFANQQHFYSWAVWVSYWMED